MLEKETALIIRNRALGVVTELVKLLSDVRDRCSEEDYQIVKRGVGLSIGRLEMDLLMPIYKQHPEIDDLQEKA